MTRIVARTMWTLTSPQIRAAREMLGWSRADLARSALLSLAVAEAVEEYGSAVMLMESPGLAIWRALEKAGVEFDASGVRLRQGERE